MEMRHFVCGVLTSLFCQRSCIAAESAAWQNGAMIFTEKLVFLDLETTGANAATDRITEIGLVEVDAGQVSRWSTLVNPQQPIPPFIQHLTGISDRMVKDAPLIDAVLDTVRSRLEGGLFIAHNARFDYGFLNNACMQAGLALPNEVLCTVKLSRRLFPSERRHNLDTLIERHQLSTGDRHRALADADLLWQLWNKFSVEIAPETFQSAVQALRQRPGEPQAKKKQTLREMK
jgi:DNA polymerase-3 subunit epsilon